MDEESVPFIEKQRREHRKTFDSRSAKLPWLLVLLLISYTFTDAVIRTTQNHGQQVWTSSDFVTARNAISLQTTSFTSSLDFSDRDHIYRVYDPDSTVYIGNASSEIDAAWDDLILPADIYISDDEAQSLSPDAKLYRSSETGLYKIELEVFHSLHCLNMIRMSLYSEAYPQMLMPNAKVHVDHCIEALRELIMCEGNMTPIPIEWSEKGERINPNYAQRHTCRNFEALKQWTKERTEKLPMSQS